MFKKGDIVRDIKVIVGDNFSFGEVDHIENGNQVYCQWSDTLERLKRKQYTSTTGLLWTYISHLILVEDVPKKIELYGIAKFCASIEKEKRK